MGGLQDGDWGSKQIPTVREHQVHYHLRGVDVHKSVEPYKVHPLMRELADIVAKPLSMMFKKS